MDPVKETCILTHTVDDLVLDPGSRKLQRTFGDKWRNSDMGCKSD